MYSVALLYTLFLCCTLWVVSSDQGLYTITYIGAANSSSATKLPMDFSVAERDSTVAAAKFALRIAEAASNRTEVLKQKQILKQALLVAQERILPRWAQWKAYRPSTSPTDSDGSYKDWKTSSEDDSGDSLTWLNEFFHPSAFVNRRSRTATGANATVYYQDYQPLTGIPYDETTASSKAFFDNLRQIHGPSVRITRISELDGRPERLFYREQGGACRFSVPFFLEPLLPHEEGAHFYVSSNGNLLTTSYAPCSYFCNEYFTSPYWPGIYLFNEDLNPAAADRSIPPLDPKKSPSTPTEGLEGFSGIWIDRYVYTNHRSDVGVANHGGNSDFIKEDLTDAERQVSVVVTYENMPAFGVVSESNFTAQIELFTNGTIIFRYRSVGPTASHNAAADSTVNPRVVFLDSFSQSAAFNVLPMLRLDAFNNTNMSNLAVVAARFDLGFEGFRSGAAIKRNGRCGPSSLLDALIPAGHRAQGNNNQSRCAAHNNCTSCLGSDAQCAWCGGYGSFANLSDRQPISGLCLPKTFATIHCPQSSIYTVACGITDHVLYADESSWDFYDGNIMGIPSSPSLLLTQQVSKDVLAAGIISRSMRPGHAKSYFVTRTNTAPSGSIPATNILLSNIKLYGLPYLRRQTSAETATTLRSSSEFATGYASGTAECYPTNDAYYGASPHSPTRFQNHFTINPTPIFTFPGAFRLAYSALQAGIEKVAVFVGFYLFRQSADALSALEMRILDGSMLALDEVHVTSLLGGADGFQYSPTVHRNVNSMSAYGERVGSFDFFYYFSSNGTISIACLAATAPINKYFGRMVAGTDPFNVWYLQESMPPSSPILLTSTGAQSTLGSPMYLPTVAALSATTMLRPGRIVSFIPRPRCPACIKGFCDPMAGKCVCKEGYGGPSCNLCSQGYFYDAEEVICRPCSACQNGYCSHEVTSSCVCRAGYSGAACECTNGAMSHSTNSLGAVTCALSSCPSAKAYCRCGVCTCREGYQGPECHYESPSDALSSETIYFIIGTVIGAPALLAAVGYVCYRLGAGRPSLEMLRRRLIGPAAESALPAALVVPEVGPPISSAPKETWTMLREAERPSFPLPSTARRSAIRNPPNVSEPDVYEPPCLHYDEGGVDFL